MQQYTQKVEAVQVSPENIDQIIQWMNGMGESQKDHKGRYMIISIQKGFGVAGEGQWIVKDRFGIYNVYHDDTFKTLYHLTPPSEAEAMIYAMSEGADLWKQEYDDCRRILQELVALKKLKDADGKTDFYQKRQPELWAAAELFLSKYQHNIY